MIYFNKRSITGRLESFGHEKNVLTKDIIRKKLLKSNRFIALLLSYLFLIILIFINIYCSLLFLIVSTVYSVLFFIEYKNCSLIEFEGQVTKYKQIEQSRYETGRIIFTVTNNIIKKKKRFQVGEHSEFTFGRNSYIKVCYTKYLKILVSITYIDKQKYSSKIK